jgi:hypothetical protein
VIDLKRIAYGPGLRAPVHLFAALVAVAAFPHAAEAQQRRSAPAQQAAPAQPVPDRMTALKLLWSTMAAADHANATGNYSVLRDLGSAGFQRLNNPATLATVFATVRQQRIDLANTLLVEPSWEIAPTMIAQGQLRMRGRFPLRPTSIAFDLIYEWDNGWRLHGISVLPFAAGRNPG